MNLAEFEDLVDRCGEQPAAWPVEVRADALKFLAESNEARDVVAEAAALREMFNRNPATPAPANLGQRIVTLAGRLDDRPPRFDKESRPKPDGVGGRVAALKRSGLPKSYLWVAACFAAGIGLTVASGLLR